MVRTLKEPCARCRPRCCRWLPPTETAALWGIEPRRHLYGGTNRLVVVVGPCFHPRPRRAMEYAHAWVQASALRDDLLIVMRVL